MNTVSNPPTVATLNLQSIAEASLIIIEWQDASTGFCKCDGEHLHSHPTGKRDCKVMLNGAPTVFCLHTSCTYHIEQANHRLRSAIGKAQRGGTVEQWKPTPEDRARQKAKAAQERLKERAACSLASILSRHAITERDFRISSPKTLDNLPCYDWRLHLQLFKADDVVWIGDVQSSGRPENMANFRPVGEWLKQSECPGSFTCGSTFKNNSYSRSNENVLNRRFLVIESDTLQRLEMLAVIQWCRLFMRLKAVVDTGGKSLHGWFEYPSEAALEQLKIILPQLGCDRALFKASQPCRLPGAWREEKGNWQKLLWLDLKGGG
jgi:hypothetical protein